MSTAIDPTPGQQRKHKAEAALARLKGEHEQVRTRLTTAQESITQLDNVIVGAQRSGDSDLLESLRSDRRAAEESVRDFQRALPAITDDIRLAEGELHAATVQCQAEAYSKIQGQQVELLRTITAAVTTLITAVAEKERLARRQDVILANVAPLPNQSPQKLRYELGEAIRAVLVEGAAPKSFGEIDWSSWQMTEHGVLLH